MDEIGIWIIDENANTAYANARMAEILETSSAEMIGQSSFDYIFPEDLDGARRLFNSKREGRSTAFRFRLQRRGGSPVWVDVQGTPMQDPTGRFMGVVGTFVVVGDDA